jgi:hypothetical protein
MNNPRQNYFKELTEIRHIFAPDVRNDLREGKCVGSGWTELLIKLLHLLDEFERASPGSIRIVQIKQKFGELRVYLAKGHPEASALIDIATAQSRTACEECGGLSAIQDRNGWFTTLCDPCLDKWSRR